LAGFQLTPEGIGELLPWNLIPIAAAKMEAA